MVDERITDGSRIAQLLSAEIDGRTDGGLGRLYVVDTLVDPSKADSQNDEPGSAEPKNQETLAFEICVDNPGSSKCRKFDTSSSSEGDDTDARPDRDEDTDALDARIPIAGVFVQDDHIRLVIRRAREVALDAASDVGLDATAVDSNPPKTIVVVESGAAVKRASDVLSAVGTASGSER